MTKIGEPLKQDVSKSGFDKFLRRPFEGLGEANRDFQEQTGYSYDELVAHMEGASVQAFTTTIAFTSTDYRTVTWAAGTISYQDGLVTPEIATSNTGAMASRTYIYYDPQASKVALNVTTTAVTATQGERLLVAIAVPNANTAGMASIEAFGSSGTYVANLSVEHLTAGSIRSKTVTLAVTAGTGDCYFNTGKTDFTNTDSGFILGIDDSDADKAKFYIGDATEYLNWDGSNLTIAGVLTATSGAIGGWTINSTSIYTGTEDHAGYTANAGDITIYSSGTDASIHAKNFYIDASGNLTCQNATISGVITIGATSSGIASFSDAGDLVTVNEGDVDALALTNAPAAAGADVTGSNTAADTALVNTLAASSVAGWAHGSDTTKIDGGDVYTNTITATQINAGTITANEISAGGVPLNKFPLDKNLMHISFESLDGWSKAGNTFAGLTQTQIYTDATTDEEAIITVESSFDEIDYSKNPFFQTIAKLSSVSSVEAHITCGMNGVWGGYDDAGDCFGFKFDDATLYAYWSSGATDYTSTISGVTTTDFHTYRAEVDSTNSKIYYYVDGVLEYTATSNFPTVSSDKAFVYHIKTGENVAKRLYMTSLLWMIDR